VVSVRYANTLHSFPEKLNPKFMAELMSSRSFFSFHAYLPNGNNDEACKTFLLTASFLWKEQSQQSRKRI